MHKRNKDIILDIDINNPKGLLKYIFKLVQDEPPREYPTTIAALEKEEYKTIKIRSKNHALG